jgi:hypothetical protein
MTTPLTRTCTKGSSLLVFVQMALTVEYEHVSYQKTGLTGVSPGAFRATTPLENRNDEHSGRFLLAGVKEGIRCEGTFKARK